jgi:uncharacterized repeat protein (TIGR01451 family)
MRLARIDILVLIAVFGTAVTARAQGVDYGIAIVNEGTTTPLAGGYLHYDFEITRAVSSDESTTAGITVTVPPELTIDGSCGFSHFDPVTRSLSWSANVLQHTQGPVVWSCPVSFHLDPSLKTGTPFSLTAALTTSPSDRNAANNTATITGVVTAASDLEVSSSADPASLRPGATLTYAFTVRNLGDIDARDVVLTDQISRVATFRSFAQTGGPPAVVDELPHDTAGSPSCISPRCGVYIEARIPNLPAHMSATFRLVVDVKTSFETVDLYNFAVVQSKALDPNTRNDQMQIVTSAGPNADLGVTSRSAAGQTNEVPITIEIANDGPDAVNSVTVRQLLEVKNLYPFELQRVRFLALSPSQGTCSEPEIAENQYQSPPIPPFGWRVACALGAMAPGAKATIDVVIKTAPAPVKFVHTSSVEPAHNDPNRQNNTSITTGLERKRAVKK